VKMNWHRPVLPGLFLLLSASLWCQGDPSGSLVMDILTEAYPGIVTDKALVEGDWSVLVRGERIFWAGGRLLPPEARERSDAYSPHPFFYYSGDYEPPLPSYTEEEKARTRARLERRDRDPPSRNPRFFDLIYGIRDEDSAWAHQISVTFLGYRLTLHRDLAERVARVEDVLREKMIDDPDLREYVDSLDYAAGYSWRLIAGTESRSNHAYGIALDFSPRDYGGREAYWLWTRDFYPDWFTLGWDRRYRPPESFVRAFETEGFLWGGKWFLFDSIHFEYRPEILLLNRSGHGP